MEPERDDHQDYPDEQGDAIRDHEDQIPRCRSVGDLEQKSDEQNREGAEGHVARGMLAQHAADLHDRGCAHQHIHEKTATASSDAAMALPR